MTYVFIITAEIRVLLMGCWNRLNSKINKEKFDVLIVNRGDKFLNFKNLVKEGFFGFTTLQNIFLNIDIYPKFYLINVKLFSRVNII